MNALDLSSSDDELAQDDEEEEAPKSDGPKSDGGKKSCGPKPTSEQEAAAEQNPEAVFDLIDADGSGDIDAAEGKFALGCAVEWGYMDKADA